MTAPALTEIVEDAANVLCQRGWLDPDAEEWPDEVVTELAELASAGPCGDLCPWLAGPDVIADHWIARRQTEYERSLPIWTCHCGAVYKAIAAWGHREEFFEARDDGLLGDRIGGVKRSSKGQVKHSDACSRCGRKFADTIADQTNPQQALF